MKSAAKEHQPASTPLLEQILDRANLLKAWEQVKKNRGAPGIDGITVEEFGEELSKHIDHIITSVLSGAYIPSPVRRRNIEKPDGGYRIRNPHSNVTPTPIIIPYFPLFLDFGGGYMETEETIFSEGLPVNTLAILERFKEIIRENNTNSLLFKPDDVRIRMIFWLLVEHISMYYWKNDREVADLLISFNTKEWDKLREHPDVQSMRVASKLEE